VAELGERALDDPVCVLQLVLARLATQRDFDLPKLDAWLNRLVSPANIEATCHKLAAAHAQPAAGGDAALRAARQALADCQRKLARHRAALEADGDPAVINQWIAETTQQQREAQRTLHQLQAASTSRQPVDPAVVRALLTELGDLAAGLDLADPEQRALFYEEMGISGLYQPANRIVLITAEPDMRRRTVRVGGGTRTLPTPASSAASCALEHDPGCRRSSEPAERS
jgi:site-specific DNA recombinase